MGRQHNEHQVEMSLANRKYEVRNGFYMLTPEEIFSLSSLFVHSFLQMHGQFMSTHGLTLQRQLCEPQFPSQLQFQHGGLYHCPRRYQLALTVAEHAAGWESDKIRTYSGDVLDIIHSAIWADSKCWGPSQEKKSSSSPRGKIIAF